MLDPLPSRAPNPVPDPASDPTPPHEGSRDPDKIADPIRGLLPRARLHVDTGAFNEAHDLL